MKNNREVVSEQHLDELLFGRGMAVQDYYIEQYASGEMLCFLDSKRQALDLHFNDDDMASAQMRRLKQLGVRIVTLG